MNNLVENGQRDFVTFDDSLEHEENVWIRYNGNWLRQGPYVYGDLMIRAGVLVNEQMILAATGHSSVSMAYPTNTASSLKLDSSNLPVSSSTLENELMPGYHICRAESPNVPIDDEHRLTNNYLSEIAYNDEAVSNGSTYYYAVVAVCDNNGRIDNSPPSNEVSATPMAPGELRVTPIEISETSLNGEMVTVPMSISNCGGLPVTFDITASIDQGTTTGSGGPDGYGYYWIDSNEPDGPEVNWIDITQIGTRLSFRESEVKGPFAMEFEFPFYGQ
jgi:hypothetical protein